MESIDVSGWPRQQLRLAYFDFTVRGEGDPCVVRAVLGEWLRLGGIDRETFEFWDDALAWREDGNLLPGWVPAGRLSTPPEEGTEADMARFLHWRRARTRVA